MKVLLTATVQSHIYQFHRLLAEILHQHGCEVHVAARDNLAEKNGLKLDFADKVYDVPFARSPKSTHNIQAYRRLKRIIEAGDYDIIHCNTPMGSIVTRLAARKARKNGTKVFYTAHGFHFYKGAPKKNWLVFYPVEKFFSRFTDKLITITHEDYRLANKKFHCRAEHIHGVGVDEKRYFSVDEEAKKKRKAEMGFAPGQKILLCVGELNANKNQIMAIQMMQYVVKKYPQAQLLFAGEGPEESNLKHAVKAFGLDKNIRILGYVTNLQDYQHITDVAISCSKREGLPLNIVEAMFSGTPVVATRNRGHRELIHDGKNGYLVDVGKIENMAQKVLLLLDNDKISREVSKNASAFIVRYGFDYVKKELVKVYGF